MKVLLYHHTPYAIQPPGGTHTQVEQTRLALQRVGVEVGSLAWWDATLEPDIIHHFGRPNPSFLQFAHQKGIRVAVTDLLGGTGARPWWQLTAYRAIGGLIRLAGVERSLDRTGWGGVDALADAVLASTEWEARLMREIFGICPDRVHVLTNGVDDRFLNSQSVPRGPWLVSTAWIGAVKRTLEVAEAAVMAGTPLWVIGKARGKEDDYVQRFMKLAKANPEHIRYEGFVPEEKLVEAYREARGFVLLSKYETLSLAALDAAACECPLLLSRQPWATTTFGPGAAYCKPGASVPEIAKALRQFYDSAPAQRLPARPMSWLEVGRKLKGIYESLLSSPAK